MSVFRHHDEGLLMKRFSALQCAAVRCCALQCAAVCCGVMQCVEASRYGRVDGVSCNVLQCV